jgi:hypothetical protein
MDEESRSYVDRVIGGGEQIRAAPKPVEPPPPKTPEIERQSVFLRHAAFWYENGEVKTSGPHSVPALPAEVADTAIKFNHAVPFPSEAAAALRALECPDYSYWPPDRCADLTQLRPAPQPEQTVTAPSVHSGFIPTRKPIVGVAVAR